MTRITGWKSRDIRFPTSQHADGSDAMNPDPDYSAAYVVLETDRPGLAGHGMTFTIGRSDLARAQAILLAHKETIGFAEMITDPDVAKVSVVGVGMRSHAGVANTMFATLASKGINILVISTSEIKV